MKQNLEILIQSIVVSAGLVVLPLAVDAAIPNPPLISLSNTGASNQIGRGLAAEASTDKMMMPNPFTYEYIAGANLSDATGTGHVYQLVLDGDAKTLIQTVAKAMNLSGTVEQPEYSTAEYPTFIIGAQDGTGPSVNLGWYGTGSWWYSDPSAYPSAECLTWETADDNSKYCSIYEEQKPTPELLPSKSQMTATALKLFKATGLNVSANQVRVEVSEWGASASASMMIGGQESPVEWSINWGSNGKLGSLSGHSVKALDKGEFKTISAKAAVSRISDWRYSGQLANSIWAKYAPQDGRVMPYATDDQIMVGEPSTKESGSEEPGSQSPEPALEPQVVKVTVTEAHEAQVMIWDKSGGTWLVPGYVLISDQSWLNGVFSLEDGIVELPEPMEISPMVK